MLVQAPRIALLAATALAAAGVSLAAADKPSQKALLDAAAAYVATFVQRFSNVVAEEIYVQKWSTDGGVLLSQRQLRSDLLLTRPTTATPYYAFREVMEVDGKTMSESESRLVRLFAKPSPNAIEEAEAITLESARYNLGNLQRTVNQPFFGLILLQASYQKRFTHSVDKIDTRTWRGRVDHAVQGVAAPDLRSRIRGQGPSGARPLLDYRRLRPGAADGTADGRQSAEERNHHDLPHERSLPGGRAR